MNRRTTRRKTSNDLDSSTSLSPVAKSRKTASQDIGPIIHRNKSLELENESQRSSISKLELELETTTKTKSSIMASMETQLGSFFLG